MKNRSSETEHGERLETLRDSGEITEQKFAVLSTELSSSLETDAQSVWSAPQGRGTSDISRRKLWHRRWFDWALAVLAAVGVVVFLVYRSNSQNEAIQKSGEVRESRLDEIQPSDSNRVSETVSQKNARLKAEQYLSVMPFSRQGLINQLV